MSSPLNQSTRTANKLPEITVANTQHLLPQSEWGDAVVVQTTPIGGAREGAPKAMKYIVHHSAMGYDTAAEFMDDWMAGNICRPVVILEYTDRDDLIKTLIYPSYNKPVPQAVKTLNPNHIIEASIAIAPDARVKKEARKIGEGRP